MLFKASFMRADAVKERRAAYSLSEANMRIMWSIV